MASRLITESDVTKGSIADPLIVDADTVITPSALDAAYARGVRVVFQRDRRSGGPPVAMKPFQPLPSPPAANAEQAPPLRAEAERGKNCDCACSCETSAKPESGSVPRRESRDWVDVLQQRRKGFDSSAFRSTAR